MRLPALALTLGVVVAVQYSVHLHQDLELDEHLKKLFPSATSFSPKIIEPLPHYRAYGPDPETDAPTLLGFAFWTCEIESDERGYNGRIHILVGMDTSGVLTSIIVVEHHDPYGWFSIDPPEFAAQFENKSIRDPIRFRKDIDALSGATHTMTGATRGVRNSSRRVAKALLKPEDVK